MALVPQTVDVPFEGGLDTNTAPKKVIPAKLLELENAVFVGGEIHARPGTQVLSDALVGGTGTLAQANALAVRGGELLRWTDTGVYGRGLGATSPWVKRANAQQANPLAYTVKPVAQRPLSCETFDCGSLFGVSVYVWTENDAAAGRTLRATVVDDATGVRYQDAVLLAAATVGTEDWRVLPRVVPCGGSIVVLYGLGGSGSTAPLNAVRLLPATPQAFSPVTTIATLKVRSAVSYPFEFSAVDLTPGTAGPTTTGRLAVAYSKVGFGISVQQFDVPSNLSLAITAAVSPAPATYLPNSGTDNYNSVNLFADLATSRLFLLLKDTTNFKVELHALNSATHAAVGSTVPIFTGTTDGIVKMTMAQTAAGAFVGYFDSPKDLLPLTTAAWDSSGIVTVAAATWAFTVRLAANAFALGGQWYVPCLYHNTRVYPHIPGVQPSVFLLDASSASVVARALVGEAGGPLAEAPSLPHTVPGASAAGVLVPVRGRVEYDANTGTVVDVTTIGLARADLAAADPASMERIEEKDALHIGGALSTYFDGSAWVEDGFNVQPEGLTASAGGGGSLAAGTYSWTVCYEWEDAIGRLHRSAPAVPVSLTVSAGASAAVVAPHLALTVKRGVRLALYRTIANGTVFYRTTDSKNSYIQPDPDMLWMSGASATLIDMADDSTIQDNEVLPYGGVQGGTVGGELWHRPPPGYAAIHRHENYLYTTLMDDPQSVAYSLPLTDGEGPTWPSELRLTVPSTHGKVVALATMDDKRIILCETGAYVVYGQGPLRNGLDNGLTEPMYITGSVGCVSHQSVVQTADGIMYQSPGGFFLLSRGLETTQLGAGVNAYKDLTVSRALEVPNRQEVRFWTQEGRTLVYSTEWRQWSTWTSQPTVDAALFGGVPYFADGTHVRQEDSTVITEAGAPVSIVVGSAWLKWAGFQGLQRVWRAILFGKAEVTTTLTSDVFYDYDDSAPGTTNTATFQGSSAGGPQAFQVSQHLSKQLCRALRFRWTLTPASTGPSDTGTVNLTSLTMEFGAHPTPAKRGRRTL